MTKCAPLWRLLLSWCLAFSLVGCSQFKRSDVAEEKDPHFLEGKRRRAGLDYQGAVESYERALQSNPNNSAAHFELALLWDKLLNDPAAAIYHYQKHLTLNTNSSQAGFARGQVDHLKRELARTHSFAVINRDIQQHIERLTSTNKIYEKRIEMLEAELARGPRYITNYVTNFVRLPEGERRGPRTLTQPTTIVDAPPRTVAEDEQPRAEVRTVEDRPRTSSTDTKVAAGRNENSRSGTSRPSTSRTQTQPQVRDTRATRPESSTAARARKHTVKPGETMQRVASMYKISVAELRRANPGMGNGTRAGQVLNIPQK